MYLTATIRNEFGLLWTRGKTRKNEVCWKSLRSVNMTIARELVRVGSRGAVWSSTWTVYEGKGAFFTTQRLRRAFQIAARHHRVWGQRSARRKKA